MTKAILSGTLAIALLAAWPRAQQQPPASQQPPAPAPQQPTEIGTTISGEAGAPPRLAVPDFIALSTDAETAAVAKTIGDVLWNDLNFEREFAFIPRDTYASIPHATSFADVPFDRWRELNADGVIVGTVQKVGAGFKVEMRLFNVRTRQAAYSRQYDGSANARLYAHTISDEIHKSQRALNGVARSRLTFDSDRDGERMTGTVQNRNIKEIYIADYDGENQKRVTVGRTLNITPRWSPDARSIAYTSYRRGGGNIFISNIFQGTLEEVTKGDQAGENWLPGDLRGEPRRLQPPSLDEPPGHRRVADLVAVGDADCIHLRSIGIAADLHRRRRWPRSPAEDLRIVLRSADLVAAAVQRNRVHVAQRPRLRHQGARPRDRPGAATHLRRRHQPEPVVRPERPAHRVHVHAVGQGADFHDSEGRQERAADYESREQRKTGLV
jgi:TolB-like protein